MESVAVFTQKPDDFTPPRCRRKANTEDKGNPADRGDTDNRAPGYCDAICCNIITIIICTDCSRIQPAYCIGEKFCSKLLMLQNIYIDMSILDSNYGSRWLSHSGFRPLDGPTTTDGNASGSSTRGFWFPSWAGGNASRLPPPSRPTPPRPLQRSKERDMCRTTTVTDIRRQRA